jgi:putative membrane protein
VRAILPAASISIPSSYVFQLWDYFVLLLLVPSAFWGYMCFKDAGLYIIDERSLTLRYRIFTKMIVLLKKNRIQALESRQSAFQRKQHLATAYMSI